MCHIAEPHEMPIDEAGNRADVVMDPNSTIGRMNIGRLYEQYYNGASRDTHKRLCEMLGVHPGMRERHALPAITQLPMEIIGAAWYYLMRFYQILSPRMHAWFTEGKVEQTQQGYLAEVVERGITVFMPTDNEPESEDIVLQLEAEYPQTLGPVSYIGNSGKRVTTKERIRIAETYFILLEKIGDDWSAVSSGKVQHHGVLAQVTKADKYAKPARLQAVRASGEAEIRIFVSYIGEYFVAEMMDRNNSPKTHKIMVQKLLACEFPSNVQCLVDRTVTPFGGSKPVQLVLHLSAVSGFNFVFAPYKPHQITYKVA